jgi:hypothetical protein
MSLLARQARDTAATTLALVRRLRPAAVLLRGGVCAAGLFALALVTPAGFVAQAPVPVALLAVGIALGPALLPGSWLVLAVELLVVTAWLARTMATGTQVAWLPLVGLAAALYVHHSLSALAAAVPLDIRLVPGVVRGWAGRVGGAVAATAVLAAVAVPVSRWVGDVELVAVPVLGALLAVVVTGLLAYALGRRRPGE